LNKPLVSIIIPTYNRSSYVVRSIQSIQQQTIHDFEIIVIDDGSTDATEEKITQIKEKDSYIRYIKKTSRTGAQASRNIGIKNALGEWIAFQDSDDEWLPNSLELRFNEAEERKVDVVHSECFIEKSSSSQRHPFGVRPLIGNIYKDLLFAPGPVFPSILVRKTALQRIGYLDEEIVSYQEWDTCIRLSNFYDFGFVPRPTFIYHIHGNESISSNPLKSAKGYEQIITKHHDEIILQLGKTGIAQHYDILGNIYSSINGYTETARRFYLLACQNNPTIRYTYHYLKSFLTRKGI